MVSGLVADVMNYAEFLSRSVQEFLFLCGGFDYLPSEFKVAVNTVWITVQTVITTIRRATRGFSHVQLLVISLKTEGLSAVFFPVYIVVIVDYINYLMFCNTSRITTLHYY